MRVVLVEVELALGDDEVMLEAEDDLELLVEVVLLVVDEVVERKVLVNVVAKKFCCGRDARCAVDEKDVVIVLDVVVGLALLEVDAVEKELVDDELVLALVLPVGDEFADKDDVVDEVRVLLLVVLVDDVEVDEVEVDGVLVDEALAGGACRQAAG